MCLVEHQALQQTLPEQRGVRGGERPVVLCGAQPVQPVQPINMSRLVRV